MTVSPEQAVKELIRRGYTLDQLRQRNINVEKFDLQEVNEPEPQAKPAMSKEDAVAELMRRGYTKEDLAKRGIQVPESSDPGMFESIGEDVGKRVQNIKDIASNPELDIPFEKDLRITGEIAGGVADVAGEVLGEGLEQAGNLVSAITPEIVKQAAGKVADFAGDVGEDIVNSDVGQLGLSAIKGGVEAYQEFKDQFPRAAGALEAMGNIGQFALPSSRAGVPIGSLGKKISQAGVNQAQKRQKSFVKDLITPKQTPTVKTQQALRTKETGFLKNKEVVPTPREEEIIEQLSNISDVSPSKSLQGNLNVLQDTLTKESRLLEQSLKNKPVVFPRKEFKATLEASKQSLRANPMLVGDAEKSAERIMNKMIEIVDENPSSALGLLVSRRKLDKWVKSQKGGKIFDPKNENALSISLREIRNTTNDFLEDKAIGTPVKESLRKQSNLFNAIDNIAPKAADEASNAINRLVQNVVKSVPLKGELARSIAVVGSIGLSGFVSPGLAVAGGAGVAAFKGGKALMGPKAKKGLGGLLRATEIAMRKTTNPAILNQIKEDKEIIESLMNENNKE